MKRFWIDDNERIVHVAYSGLITDVDLLVGLDTYPRVDPGYSFLIDLTEVQDFITSQTGMARAAQSWGPTPRHRVVIAPTPMSYGFARMYAALADRSGIEVFRNSTDAWRALRARRSDSSDA